MGKRETLTPSYASSVESTQVWFHPVHQLYVQTTESCSLHNLTPLPWTFFSAFSDLPLKLPPSTVTPNLHELQLSNESLSWSCNVEVHNKSMESNHSHGLNFWSEVSNIILMILLLSLFYCGSISLNINFRGYFGVSYYYKIEGYFWSLKDCGLSKK